MSVKLQKIHETSTTTDFPTNGAVTYTTGINFQGGPVEYLICRGDLLFAATPVANGDMTNLLKAFRIIVNGEVVHDFRAGFNSNAVSTSGNYNYLLNAIGGRALEKPATEGKTREWYWGIPLGLQLGAGVQRMEIIMEWATGAAAVASGNLSFWVKYNDGMQNQTTVVSPTSFTHAVALEQVVVRIPQNIPGVVSAILVQNDAAEDQFASQGIRCLPISGYGLEIEFWRWLNGDLMNGNMFADFNTSLTQQQYDIGVAGCTLLPTFGLAGGDVVLAVDSSHATTRTYTPILTAPVSAKQKPEVVQTQTPIGSTAGSIVNRTEN
tara:strand:+ start:4072 stop:5040 length:969 start_codon:yes stop_codon:yes gene_type:complete